MIVVIILSLFLPTAFPFTGRCIWDRVEQKFVDENYVFVNVSLSHLSRTVKALNLFAYAHVDLPDDSMLKDSMSVEYGNQFHPFPMNVQGELCQIFSKGLQFITNMLPNGTIIPDKCPVKKGIITKISEFVLDCISLPATMTIPRSQWNKVRYIHKLHYGKNKLISQIHFDVNIDHDYAIVGTYNTK